MTLLEQLNQIPPPYVRLIALPLTEKDIARKSGLSVRTVNRISNSRAWPKRLDYTSAFLEACGIKITLLSSAMQQLKKAAESGKGIENFLMKKKRVPLWQRRQQRACVRRIAKL